MAIGFPVKDNYVTGEVLTAANMNDLSGTVNLVSGSQSAANKNAVINGNFDIWQRGTSFTAGNAYTADRWYLTGTVGAVTISRETSTVATGSLYSLKIAPTGAAGVVNMNQAIETLNAIRFAGQTVTLSVDAAATASTTISTQLWQSSSTDVAVGGSWTQITATSGGSGTVSTSTFSKISGVYAVPSTAKSLLVVIVSSGSAGQSAFLDNVQLELGAVATTFARAGGTIQGELAACQRYYQLVTRDNYAYVGSAFTTSQAAAPIIFLQPMRVAPAISLAAAGSGTGQMSFLTGAAVIPGTIGTFNATNITYSGFRLDSSGFTSAFTAGQAVFLWAASASVDIWKASAEL
jgi:hypothetical protein